MKLGLVLALAALGASAAVAAEPNAVVGLWKPEQTRDRIAMPSLDFTADGRVFFAATLSVADRPGSAFAGPRQEIFGLYQTRGDKVLVRVWSGGAAAFELTKDDRLCVYPGAGVMPANGVIQPKSGLRQCYERATANRS